MRFLIDANIPRSLTDRLLSLSHDVLDIRAFQPPPIPDAHIYKLSCEQKRIIITRDTDFSNILIYPPNKCGGIIVLRSFLISTDGIIKIILDLLHQLSESEIREKLIIAESHRYRIYNPTE